MKQNPRRTNSTRRNKLRQHILATQNICYICGKPVNKNLKTPHPMSPEIDEIIPVSLGGNPYDPHNCRLAHRYCNQTKSNHTITYVRKKILEKNNHKTKQPQPTTNL